MNFIGSKGMFQFDSDIAELFGYSAMHRAHIKRKSPCADEHEHEHEL